MVEGSQPRDATTGGNWVSTHHVACLDGSQYHGCKPDVIRANVGQDGLRAVLRRGADMLHDPPCKAIDHVCQLAIVGGAETSVAGSLGDGPKTVSLARPFPGTTVNKMCWQVRLPI